MCFPRSRGRLFWLLIGACVLIPVVGWVVITLDTGLIVPDFFRQRTTYGRLGKLRCVVDIDCSSEHDRSFIVLYAPSVGTLELGDFAACGYWVRSGRALVGYSKFENCITFNAISGGEGGGASHAQAFFIGDTGDSVYLVNGAEFARLSLDEPGIIARAANARLHNDDSVWAGFVLMLHDRLPPQFQSQFAE